MNSALLATLAFAYGSITFYFCRRYYLRRRLPSLVCAFMPLGWVVAFGLHSDKLPADWIPVLFIVAFFFAVLSLWIIVSHETQREQPFK